ncbi:MAG TPA: tetratricopeptide repeat protein, partial [Myxococcota bacterium]
ANPFGAPPAAATNPFGPTPAAAANPFGAPAPSANPFGPPPGAGSPFGPAGASPFGPPPGGGSPFGDALPPPPAPPANDDPFSSMAFNQPSPSSSSSSSSSSMAADPFGSGPGSSPSNPGLGSMGGFDVGTTTAGPGQWTLRTAVGDEVLELAELRDRLKLGTVRPDDLVAPGNEPFKPAREHAALGVALAVSKVSEVKPRASGASATSFSLPKPLVAALVAVVVVVGGGVALKTFMPEIFEKQSDAGINPLRRAKTLWQRQFPDVEGTAQEHLVEGRKQMQLDTAAGYRKADEELKQSLLLDIGNVDAIGTFAENFANLPTVRADLETSTLAREGLEFALKKEPGSAELLRAQGALKLALGDVDDALRVLAKATAADGSDVETKVLTAKANLDRSPKDALTLIQAVRQSSPDLKAAMTIEGAAQRRLGAFKESRELLEARLASDPTNVGALKEMAKLELDLGHADAALKALVRLLEAEDKDVEAWLLRAKITYQIKGGTEGLKTADLQLKEILSKHEGAAGDLLMSVLAHSTIVKSRLGDVDGAITLGERARATDANYPSALYALGRAYQQKGDVEGAKKTLENAVRAAEQRDQPNEPLVRAEFAGALAAGGNDADAIRNFEKVIEYDSRNIRAHFGFAALHMKAGHVTQAMTVMRRALANDPKFDIDRLVPTDYPTPRSDFTVWADAFRDAKIDAGDESLSALRAATEGMIRYHGGERDKATALFEKALKLDRYSHAALLYLAVMDLDAGRVADARRRLKIAVETTATSHPVTRLYLARAELLSGDQDTARKRLQDLVETEPTLVQARYSLAMVLRAQQLEAQATEMLKAVVRQDPDFLPAKQALAEKL